MGGHEGHGERHNQATDDQGCSSGKVQRSPNAIPTKALFTDAVFTMRVFTILACSKKSGEFGNSAA
jgi:hypothetical protein